MARFNWKARRDEIAAMLDSGMTAADVARHYGKAPQNAWKALREMGLRAHPEAVAKARRLAMNAPEARERARATLKKRYENPQERERLLACLELANSGDWHRHNRDRSLAQAARGRAIYSERQTGWCPPKFRAEYRKLQVKKKLTAAEARAALEPDIREWLQTFEGKLWLLSKGKARVVEAQKIARPHHFELTGRVSI